MKFSDLLIIYLASGSPFAVYFFLQSRKVLTPFKLWIKTFFVFIGWILFALNFIKIYKSSAKSEVLVYKNDIEKKLFSAQKEFEAILLENKSNVSIYEFREVLERYVGLTLALQNENAELNESMREFSRVSGNKNPEISAVCFQRRNRERLFFHHTGARRDFLKIVTLLSEFNSTENKFRVLASEFVKLLNDSAALTELEIIWRASSQIDDINTVKYSEKDLWKTETHKPLPVNHISTHLQSMNLTTNFRSKD